tara:strand:+ start:377 stop:574 length:198 start_codon:yes stop_codon:yes gene_type:complete
VVVEVEQEVVDLILLDLVHSQLPLLILRDLVKLFLGFLQVMVRVDTSAVVAVVEDINKMDLVNQE